MKKTVHYTAGGYFLVKGQSTYVKPIDHTSPLVSNTTEVRTSPIVRIGENGEFETENSIYKLVYGEDNK